MNWRPVLRQLVRGAGLVEGVGVALEQRQVGVHARPGVLGERLGHERGEDALLEGHLLDDGPEGHDVVGGRERVGVAQVDLVLPGSALVVAELHRDAHRLEHGDGGPAEVVAVAVGHVVEVAGLVDGLGALAGGPALLEEEELDLGVGVEREALVRGLGQGPLQHVPGVGDARGAVGQGQVAEHPGGARALAAPRQHLEGGGVGLGQHVGLVDPGEALDDRAVEADALGEGALELGRGDRDGLQGAEHVGEPEPDEPDVALFDGAEDELLLTVHVSILPHPCFLRVTRARIGVSRPAPPRRAARRARERSRARRRPAQRVTS